MSQTDTFNAHIFLKATHQNSENILLLQYSKIKQTSAVWHLSSGGVRIPTDCNFCSVSLIQDWVFLLWVSKSSERLLSSACVAACRTVLHCCPASFTSCWTSGFLLSSRFSHRLSPCLFRLNTLDSPSGLAVKTAWRLRQQKWLCVNLEIRSCLII